MPPSDPHRHAIPNDTNTPPTAGNTATVG